MRSLQKKYNNILLCVRPTKYGLGTAITGVFKTYLSLKICPKYIVTIDADYSHDPRDIPRLVSNVQRGHNLVVGSRYWRGGKIAGWSFARKIISRCANAIAKSVVGKEVRDCTSGFRCYSTMFVEAIISSLHSQTYEILIETVKQARSKGFSIKEIPILFVNRKKGKSKLTRPKLKHLFAIPSKLCCAYDHSRLQMIHRRIKNHFGNDRGKNSNKPLRHQQYPSIWKALY